MTTDLTSKSESNSESHRVSKGAHKLNHVPPPLISVVIPAYNAERTLAATLSSVVQQTVQDFEVLVVDDGSTDSTASVATEFRDERIHVVSRANGGHAAARNSGIAAATGRYVAFLDADNLWVPNKLERQMSWLRQSSTSRALQSGTYFVRDDLAVLYAEPCISSSDPLLDSLCFRNLPDVMSTLVAERALLEEIGGFDESLRILQDWDLAIRLARCGQLHSLPDPLSAYRLHSTNQSRDVALHVAPGLKILERVFSDSDLPPHIRRSRRLIYARFYTMLCGGELQYRQWAAAARWACKAISTNPATLGYMLSMPARSRRRRRTLSPGVRHRTEIIMRQAAGQQPSPTDNRRIRVLHLISDSVALEYFRLIVEHTDRSRFDLTVGSLDPPGRLHEGLAKIGIPTISLRTHGRRDYPRAIIALARWLRHHEIDVVQVHLFEASFVGLVASRLARTPISVFSGHHSHEVPLHHRPSLLAADRIMARGLADQVVAPSGQMRDTFVTVHGCAPEKVNVIHHGLDLARWDPAKSDGSRFRAEQRLEGKLVLGAVSRFFWVKNLTSLVTAFAALAPSHADLALVIIGGAGDSSPLDALAREIGVSDRIRILGRRSDIADAMAAFDVFVHPALAESFGFVIVEAMAMQLPVVSTRVGIAEEIIEDGVSGVLARGMDPDGIRDAIAEILAMQARWTELGTEARRRALAFTAERWVRQHEEHYEQWLTELDPAARLAIS
jgi:glycosyltransferase involved in cell wall biosynthesis